MGVDKTDYVIVGYRLPYDLADKNGDKIQWYDDKFLRYVEGWKDEPHALIVDGMSGEYAVFGQVLASGDDSSGFEFTEIDLSKRDDSAVMQKFYLLFKDYINEFERPKLFAFSHFS